jgi:uncharacterized protein (TIRG00374 family)
MEQQTPSAQRQWFRRPRFWVGVVISILTLYLAVRDVQWSGVAAALSKANVLLVVLALGTVLLNTLGKALRWRLLFFPRQQGLAVKDCTFVLLIGQLANNLLPARSGDLLRALLIDARSHSGKALGLATVVVEKAMDGVMLLSLAALLSLRMPLPQWLGRSSFVISTLLVILLVVAMITARHREKIVSAVTSWIERHPWLAFLRLFRRLAEASRELGALRDTRVQVQLWAASVLVWVLGAVTNVLVLWALDLHIDPLASPLLLVVLMAGAILPTSPLQLGVFHYLCVITLSLFGVSQTVALSYALLLHLVVYLPIVIGGVLGIWLGPWSKEGPALFEAQNR